MTNSFCYVQTFVYLCRVFGFSESIKCLLNNIVSDITWRIVKTNAVKVHGFKMSPIPCDEGISRELHACKVFKLHETLATRIRASFVKNWRRLTRDQIHAFGMLFMKACEFGAGGVGYLGARDTS